PRDQRPGGRARRSRAGPTSCRQPTARRARRSARRRARGSARTSEDRDGSPPRGLPWPVREAQLQREEERDADDDEQRAHREGGVEVEGELLVDRKRERLGHAAEAAGEHDRRAELPERAGEGERRAGSEPAARERQRHPEERLRGAGAERARRGDEVGIDGLEGGDRGADVERARDERYRQYNSRQRERDLQPECA